MELIMPYQPKFAEVPEPKEKKYNLSLPTLTATVVLAGALATTTHPGIKAFAREQADTINTKVLTEVVKSPIVSKVAPEVQKKVVETVPAVAKEIINQVKTDKISIPEEVKEIATKTVAQIDKAEVKATSEKTTASKVTIEKSSPTVAKEKTIDKSKIIAFNPVDKYKRNYLVYGHPKIATLSQEQVESLKNSMIRPLPRASYDEISSPFAPRNLIKGEDFHHGVDYPAPIGTPVYAAADGVVVYSGVAGGYGSWIVLQHKIGGETYYTIYGHMKAEDSRVKEGQTVKQGDTISLVNSQGTSTAAHLHFSIAKSRDAKSPRLFFNYINPTFTVDVEKSNKFQYKGYTPPAQPKVWKEEDYSKVTEKDFWEMAKRVGSQTGWDPIFLFSQWSLETANFTSDVLRENNNLAGMTWFRGCKYPIGTPRPESEGRNYIKYPNPEVGYLSFIKNTRLYKRVKDLKTPEEQAKEVASKGWATDDGYEGKLMAKIQETRKKFVTEPEPVKTEPAKPTVQTPSTPASGTEVETSKPAETPVTSNEGTKEETKPASPSTSSSETENEASKPAETPASSDDGTKEETQPESKQEDNTQDESSKKSDESSSQNEEAKSDNKSSDNVSSEKSEDSSASKEETKSDDKQAEKTSEASKSEDKKEEKASETSSEDKKDEVQQKIDELAKDIPRIPFIMKQLSPFK